MAPKLRRFAKRAVMLGCAALCLWCGALRVGDWARAQGAQALLFAAGLGEEAAPAGDSKKINKSSLAGPAIFLYNMFYT